MKRERIITANTTLDDIDLVDTYIKCNSETAITLTLPAVSAPKIGADSIIVNFGAGTVTAAGVDIVQGGHGHIVCDNGTSWKVALGGGGAETDPIFSASPAAEISSGNISNWNDAQKNSDILKSEIEEKLTGEIDSHFHRTKPQQWKDYPDSPEEAKAYPYQMLEDYGDGDVWLDCWDREVYTVEAVIANFIGWYLSDGVWEFYNKSSGEMANYYASDAGASNYDIYTTSEKIALVYAQQNDYHIPSKSEIESVLTGEISSHSHAGSTAVYYEPLVNGDPTAPEIMFDDSGDIIMVEV